MMNEKEFSMTDAFIALNELDDDSVESMVKPKRARISTHSSRIVEGKGYPLSGTGKSLEAAKEFLNENEDVQLEVIDPDADSLEHMKDRIDYVGQMILRCNRCHANRFIDMSDLVESEEKDIYNVDDECPTCKTSGIGYEIIGQVGKFEDPKAEESDTSDEEADQEQASDEAEETVAIENDSEESDELKFDNDETDIEDEAAESEDSGDEVVETSDSEEDETEPDMMETETSEDDEDNIDVEEDEEEEEDVQESLYKPALYEDADKAAEYKKEALMYDKIIEQMAAEGAQDAWESIWPKYESKVGNLTTRDIVDLADEFEEIYRKYHNDGLLAAEQDVIKTCAELDKEYSLAAIENHRMYVEDTSILENTTVSEVLGSILDADKVGRIEVTNRCDNKKDQKVYDGDYNNLPLNIASSNCTSFDVNNRTLACNIDQDKNHGRRCLGDILDKFGDNDSDNIHLYDIASSDELFRGKKSDAIGKFGNCGFISIDTPAVIRMVICNPSITCSESPTEKSTESSLVEHIIAENDLSITRLDKFNSNEYWINESIKEREDLDLIYETYVKPCSKELIAEFKKVTGYTNALDAAFDAGYNAALSESYSVACGHGAESDIKESVADDSTDVDEDFADVFRKTFDKPASINTQQAWEDEMVEIETELGYGNPSDKRKEKLQKRHDKLAGKFAQQRDWEARHEVDANAANDKAADPEPVGVSEAYLSREQLIAELKAMGKNYYFDKYTDAQLYRIHQKEVNRAAQSRHAATNDAANVPATCENCGNRLNDSGTCPVCDHGEEDLIESADEWDDDALETAPEAAPEAMSIDDLRQIVYAEMPRAIKEWGTNVRALIGHFLTIMEEAEFQIPSKQDLKDVITDYLAENSDSIPVDESVKSFKTRKDLAAAITECKNNSRPYTVRRSLKEGYRYDLILESDGAEEESDAAKEPTDQASDSPDNMQKEINDLNEGDNLPAPAADTSVALTAEEAEVNARIMRISQDISQAILDVYGIEADPALIVADILQDLGLISGQVRPEDLADTPLNRATIDMYHDHEAFWAFMNELASALAGQPLDMTPEAKIKRAIKMLAGPSFSTSAIIKGIESTQFQRLVAQGKVPFVPAGSTPLLGEELEDDDAEIDVNVEKFDAEMNEYFNEAYDDTAIYVTTSGRINEDGSIELSGEVMTEAASMDVNFTLKPQSELSESLSGNESDIKTKLESLDYVVTNDKSDEVFTFNFND